MITISNKYSGGGYSLTDHLITPFCKEIWLGDTGFL